MFMCVVNLKSVNKLDLTWKQSFLILVSFMLSVANKPIMLSVIMMNAVVLNFVEPKLKCTIFVVLKLTKLFRELELWPIFFQDDTFVAMILVQLNMQMI